MRKVQRGNNRLLVKVCLVGFCIMATAILLYFIADQFKANRIPSKLNGEYIAEVNGEKVYLAEFNFFSIIEKNLIIAEILKEHKDIKPKGEDEVLLQKVDGRLIGDIVKEKLLDRIIDFKVKWLKAQESGLKLNRTEIAALLQEIKEVSQRGDSTIQKYYYKIYGLDSEKEYVYVKAEERLVGKFEQQMYDRLPDATEQEAMDYYQENQKNYIQEGSETIKAVVFNLDNRKNAEKVLEEIKSGKISFEAAVDSYSEDEKSRRRGGLFTRNREDKDERETYEWLLYDMQKNDVFEGQLSAVISADRLYIAKRIGKEPDRVLPFEEVEMAVYQATMDDKFKKMTEEWRSAYLIELDMELIKKIKLKSADNLF